MMGQRQQQVFLMPLLVGTDGVQKMSKSLGNYIAVDEPPNDMYGKVMSIKDPLIMPYFELLTDVPDQELVEMKQQLDEQVNPMELKKRLARDIVTQFHGAEEARKADERFASVRQRREVPVELRDGLKFGDSASVVVEMDISKRIVEAGLAKSISEAKRLITQNAVTVDDRKLNSTHAELRDGSIIKVGKRGFIKIIDANKMTWEVAQA
jgi:tyrosyl-tRNA synthetase